MKTSPFGIITAALSLVVLSTPAFAGGFVLAEHGFYVIDFLVIAYFIKKFGSKPLKNFLVNRRDAVSRELDEAKKLHEAAKLRLEEYESKLNALEDEKESIRKGFVAVAEKEKTRILKEAEAQATRLVADAKVRIDQEAAKLTRSLEEEAVEMAMTMASTKITAALTPGKQQALLGDAIATLESLDQNSLAGEQN